MVDCRFLRPQPGDGDYHEPLNRIVADFNRLAVCGWCAVCIVLRPCRFSTPSCGVSPTFRALVNGAGTDPGVHHDDLPWLVVAVKELCTRFINPSFFPAFQAVYIIMRKRTPIS